MRRLWWGRLVSYSTTNGSTAAWPSGRVGHGVVGWEEGGSVAEQHGPDWGRPHVDPAPLAGAVPDQLAKY
jgi:hypothetical protein